VAQLAEQSVGNPKFKGLNGAAHVIGRKCGELLGLTTGKGYNQTEQVQASPELQGNRSGAVGRTINWLS
jgi:hypothetical protein